VVDGAGLKNTLENRLAPFMENHIKPYLDQVGRKALSHWGQIGGV